MDPLCVLRGPDRQSSNGRPNGLGRVVFNNGNRISGFWRDGKLMASEIEFGSGWLKQVAGGGELRRELA